MEFLPGIMPIIAKESNIPVIWRTHRGFHAQPTEIYTAGIQKIKEQVL